jgi:hypothetical protein
MQTITLKIRNDAMAQGLLAFLRGLSEVDVAVDAAPAEAAPDWYDPEFPGFDERSWENLAADLEDTQRQIDRGEYYTLEEMHEQCELIKQEIRRKHRAAA